MSINQTAEYFPQISFAVATVTTFDFSASFNTDAVSIENLQMGSVRMVMTAGATATGTMELQVSDGQTSATPNWTTWTGTVATVNGTTGSPFFWDLNFLGAHWIRMSFIRAAGTGNGNAILVRKAWP